jgi:hypothetical protein
MDMDVRSAPDTKISSWPTVNQVSSGDGSVFFLERTEWWWHALWRQEWRSASASGASEWASSWAERMGRMKNRVERNFAFLILGIDKDNSDYHSWINVAYTMIWLLHNFFSGQGEGDRKYKTEEPTNDWRHSSSKWSQGHEHICTISLHISWFGIYSSELCTFLLVLTIKWGS